MLGIVEASSSVPIPGILGGRAEREPLPKTLCVVVDILMPIMQTGTFLGKSCFAAEIDTCRLAALPSPLSRYL